MMERTPVVAYRHHADARAELSLLVGYRSVAQAFQAARELRRRGAREAIVFDITECNCDTITWGFVRKHQIFEEIPAKLELEFEGV